jgi:AcrR family transcriptional regulator
MSQALESPGKRVRRRPEEARRQILDAAEASMTAAGPAGLRLTDVAERAGVSHPTILHHFGSREGLVRALNQRNLEDLKTAVIRQMTTDDQEGNAIATTFAAYRGGIAQRMLWLIQSAADAPAGKLHVFDDIVNTVQAVREKFARPGTVIDIADTRAAVHLTTIAAFGDAILGPRIRQGGSEELSVGAFEKWFGRLLDLHFRHYGEP